ncbi:MAG TPA: alpha-galactosidase [Steroidobacteraceae bacterium]|nr:alpha-galactosidase [Steroidobacteraceae bacterium]
MIRRPAHRIAPLLAIVLFPAFAHAQLRGTLATSDVAVELRAGATAPQLLRLRPVGQPPWVNTVPEKLPSSIERDGVRIPLEWRLMRGLSFVRPGKVAFVYESRQPHLRLTWEWQAPAKFGPLQHRIIVSNFSGREYWLAPLDSLHLQLRVPARVQLVHFYVDKGGGEPTAQGTHEVRASEGYRWTGWSTTFSHPVAEKPREIIPYEAVFLPRNAGRGWFAGIQFSGRTRLTLQRAGDRLSTILGLDPDPGPVVTRLAPRGKFETPTVFLGTFSGGPDGAGNQLRPWVRAVLGSVHTWSNPDYPLTVNNSWGAGMGISETVAKKMIADAAALGFEMYHLDAGWFRGVGDWYPDPRKFPHGLAPLTKDAHEHGMKFGLWVDWAQAGIDTEPGALNARDPKVRDWLVADVAPSWKPQDFKGQTIDLGVPAAKAYAEREVNRLVRDYHLDMLEHDGYLVAQGCARTDHPHAAPDPHRMSVRHYAGEDIVTSSNSTDVSYHAVHAYYDIYEQLRRLHPHLLLEICNDGGRMIDFGSAAHGDYFSMTDTYTPLANRRAFYDASFVLPPAMLEAYEARWPTPKPANFLYMLRSGMMGWLTVMQNTNEWTAEEHAAARQAITLYKTRLRPLIRDAELFHISARPDGVHWDGMEYWDPARGQGVIYAFHGSDGAEPKHRFVLSGLNAQTTYRLHFEDRTSPDIAVSGQQLMTSGLQVALRQPLSSELILLSAR